MKSKLNKSGFTLMELMIALGILAVGLALVSTAFPSAMMENKESVEKTMTTIIGENALAICHIRLSHNDIKDIVGTTLTDITDRIPLAERAYPIAQGEPAGNNDDWIETPAGSGNYLPSSRYGWLLVAKQFGGDDDNDYLLVIVPYRKLLPDDQIPCFQQVTTDGNKITSGNIFVGSPVISITDGSFAFVVDAQGNLSRNITPGNALVVAGKDSNGNVRTGADSPAIGCYVARTNVLP